MKVYEILQEVYDRPHKAKSKIGHIPIIPLKKGSSFDESKMKNYVGSGIAATTYGHPSNPHSVIKIINVKFGADMDGQIANTNMILEHQDNPFFPKIYKAIIFKHYDPGGQHKMYIEMERLHSMTSEKLEHNHLAILHSLGIDPDLINHDNDGEMFEHLYNLEDVMKLLTHPNNIPMDFIKKIKNPKFVEAIQALRDTKIKTKVWFDLHSGNYMYRLTSVGPQLVIIDPFI